MIAEHYEPQFIKIATEGFEVEVLKVFVAAHQSIIS
jgi:hypothetical protein